MDFTLFTGALRASIIHAGKVHFITSGGVEVYDQDGTLTAWAWLPGITCGACNTEGIYVGTSTTGVYRLRHVAIAAGGEVTPALWQVFTSESTPALGADIIMSIAGRGMSLLVGTSAGVDYIPDVTGADVYHYTDANGCRACAVAADYIAWGATDTTNIVATPTEDWTAPDATVDIADPNALKIGDNGTDLVVCHAGGVSIAAVDIDNLPSASATLTTDFEEYTAGSQPPDWTERWSTASSTTEVFSLSGDKVLRLYTTASGRCLATWDDADGLADVDMTVKFTAVSASPVFGVAARASGESGSMSGIHANVSGIANTLTMFSYVAGTYAALGSVAISLNDSNSEYYIRLQVTGDSGDLTVRAKYWAAEDPEPETWSIDTTSAAALASGWVGVYNSAYTSTIYVQSVSIDDLSGTGGGGVPEITPDDDYGSTELGTVTDCLDAAVATGILAYGTSDGEDGGRFGLLDLSSETNLVTVSGDCAALFFAEDGAMAVHGNTLNIYAGVLVAAPGQGAAGVRRDWSLYAEITDVLEGIASGSVALKINRATVTPTLTAITDGYRVEYTPGSPSGYSARVSVDLSADDAAGNAVSKNWYFTTIPAPAASVTDQPPPNVVCIRDIGLTEGEADETISSIPVIWLDDIAGPLIVNDSQAEAVGKAVIDENTFHRHVRTVRIEEDDISGADPQDLQQGGIVTLTCPAIGMTEKKCEVLAVQRHISKGQTTTWNLKIAYYEAVA